MVQFLLDKLRAACKVQDSAGELPLHIAVRAALLTVVQCLGDASKAGLQVKDANGNLPLHIAVQCATLEVIEWLVGKCDITLRKSSKAGWLPLHVAVQHSPLEVVRCLVDKYELAVLSTTKQGSSPLHIAAQFAQCDIVEFLVERGEQILVKQGKPKSKHLQLKDCCGSLPLHVAARYASLKVVKILESNWEYALREKDKAGALPLHVAAKFASLDVVEFLASERPCALEEKTYDGWFPLHIAVRRDAPLPVIRCLVESRAHIPVLEKENRNGLLPLHVAAQFATLEKVQFLAEKLPGTLNVETPEGQLAVDVASQNSDRKVREWLKKAMHDRDPNRVQSATEAEPPVSARVQSATADPPVSALRTAIREELDPGHRALARFDMLFINKVPRLFIIVPVDIKSGWRHPASWMHNMIGTTYNLFFLCDVSHDVVSPPIELKLPKQWVQKLAPVVVNALRLLQMSMKLGLNLSLDLHDAVAGIFSFSWELTSSNVAEMLQVFTLFVDSSSDGLMDRIRSNKLSDKDMHMLSGDEYELVRNEASKQKGWRSKMEPVRKPKTAGSASVFWVTKAIAADETYGFEVVRDYTAYGATS